MKYVKHTDCVQLGLNARIRKPTKLLRTMCVSDKVFERFLTFDTKKCTSIVTLNLESDR